MLVVNISNQESDKNILMEDKQWNKVIVLIITLLLYSQSAVAQQDTLRTVYLKTNTAAWAFLTVNASGEIDVAPHWSADLSISWSGWDYFSSGTKFRTFNVRPEIRYWFADRNYGWFAGAHLGIAYYNFAFNGEKRYQDHDGNTPAYGGGLAVGYRRHFGHDRRWLIEVSAGAGVYALDYDVFRNKHNGLIIDRCKKTYFGLDNIALSFGYTFYIKR